MSLPEITLLPLQPEDREQFILDNQWAFKYGAQQEFGLRDERCEEGEEVISRKTIEDSIDGENAEASTSSSFGTSSIMVRLFRRKRKVTGAWTMRCSSSGKK